MIVSSSVFSKKIRCGRRLCRRRRLKTLTLPHNSKIVSTFSNEIPWNSMHSYTRSHNSGFTNYSGWCGSPVVRRWSTNPGVRGSNPGPGLEISEMLFSVSHLHGTEKKLSVMSEVPV